MFFIQDNTVLSVLTYTFWKKKEKKRSCSQQLFIGNKWLDKHEKPFIFMITIYKN